MSAPKNHLKARLAAGDTLIGLWLGFGHATVAEISASAGFDWCLIDAEHNPNSDAMVMAQLQAMNGGAASPVMRVTSGEDWMIKRALDMGVQSVLVPMVHTADDAARVVRAMRYPPQGVRGMGAGQARATGYGAVSDYPTTANAEICVMIQIESREAVKNIDAICATDGVDVVFVGPADLSADMGYPGQAGAPEVTEAIDHVARVVLAAGKTLGSITFEVAEIATWKRRGARFLAVGGDIHSYANSVRALAATARDIISPD